MSEILYPPFAALRTHDRTGKMATTTMSTKDELNKSGALEQTAKLTVHDARGRHFTRKSLKTALT
jgi:hypothetical protein